MEGRWQDIVKDTPAVGIGIPSHVPYIDLDRFIPATWVSPIAGYRFSVSGRQNRCPACERGYSPECEEAARRWYGTAVNDYEDGWQYALSQEDVHVLFEAGCLPDYDNEPANHVVNAMHDAGRLRFDLYARDIAVRAWATRNGIFSVECPVCGGTGVVEDENDLIVVCQAVLENGQAFTIEISDERDMKDVLEMIGIGEENELS